MCGCSGACLHRCIYMLRTHNTYIHSLTHTHTYTHTTLMHFKKYTSNYYKKKGEEQNKTNIIVMTIIIITNPQFPVNILIHHFIHIVRVCDIHHIHRETTASRRQVYL